MWGDGNVNFGVPYLRTNYILLLNIGLNIGHNPAIFLTGKSEKMLNCQSPNHIFFSICKMQLFEVVFDEDI